MYRRKRLCLQGEQKYELLKINCIYVVKYCYNPATIAVPLTNTEKTSKLAGSVYKYSFG